MKRNMKIELSLDKRKEFDNIYFSVCGRQSNVKVNK